VERLLVFTNEIARIQEFDLSTLHTKGQSPSSVLLYNTLERSLGQIRIETQIMIERLWDRMAKFLLRVQKIG